MPNPTLRLGATLISGLLASFCAVAQTGQPTLPKVQLNAGIHNIRAEVASTPDQRSTGLMFRREMATNDGMLFIFDEPGVQCFWMRNTLLPLQVAFVADDGTVVNVDEMKPQTEASHCSTAPVRYVLEMNTGWFTKRGIGSGSRLTGVPFTPARKP